MKIKWKFALPALYDYVIGEDKHIYKLPFTSNNKQYSARKIKKQHGNRYWLNGQYWSESQLKPHIVQIETTEYIYPPLEETPF